MATNIGVLLGLHRPLGLIFLAVWLAVAFAFRMSSLAALTASLLTPLWAYLLGRTDLLFPAVILGVAIFLTHRANIARLLKGEEPKISLSKQS